MSNIRHLNLVSNITSALLEAEDVVAAYRPRVPTQADRIVGKITMALGMLLKTTTITVLAGLACALSSPPASAQFPTIKTDLTMAQIVSLDAGMKALDAGSIEQCGPQKDSKPATAPCPYRKDTDLIIAIAENTLQITGPLQALQKEQSDLRAQVMGDNKMKMEAKGAAWASGQQRFSEQKVTIYALRTVPLSAFNIGAAPGRNEIPGDVVRELAPMIALGQTTSAPAGGK